jgi:putative ABC transport system permease protein
MNLSNIKHTLRSINKNRLNSLIKITGITLAIVPAALIWTFVEHETKYDLHFVDSERTFRIIRNWQEDPKYGAYTPVPLLATMLETFPEVEEGTRVWPMYDREAILNTQIYRENVMLAVDPSFFSTFGMELIKGSSDEALKDPGSVVISKTMAHILFGDINPLGENIEFAGYGFLPENNAFTISGVYDDFPSTSHLQGNFIFSIEAFGISNISNRTNHLLMTYIKLNDPSGKGKIEDELPGFMEAFYGKDYFDYARSTYLLQPITDIHLNTEVNYNQYETAKGSYTSLYIFPVLAFLIILISSFNFVNLTISEGALKQKSFGINKIAGAGKLYFFKFYILESLTLTFIGLILASLVLRVVSPFFSAFVERDIDFLIYANPFWIIGAIIFSLLIGVINGLYPAYLFSSKSMISFLTEKTGTRLKNNNIQHLFQVLQFAICIGLIIGSAVVFKQLEFINLTINKSIDKENTLLIKNADKLNNKQGIFKSELKKINGVLDASVCNEVPGISRFSHWGQPVDPASFNAHIAVFNCDYNYLSTLNLQLLEGRFFDPDHSTDDRAIVLNETAIKVLGWKDNPIGKRYRLDATYRVIGVVKDIYFESFHHEIIPQGFILQSQNSGNIILVKIGAGQILKTIDKINQVWSEFVPDRKMHYGFLDDEFAFWYKTERKTGYVAFILALIAIFLSGFGLLALVLQTINTRVKEIGIRKVNGAKTIQVIAMLNKDFVKWVLVAFGIAMPLAWYIMHKWLDHFAYRTHLSWWIFALAGVLALGIALLTVSFQSWKAATRNPVEALRYE